MSRAYDAKRAALKAYPDDPSEAIALMLGYLDTGTKDFIYEQGMTPSEYLFGGCGE